jgi:hypothetical protein
VFVNDYILNGVGVGPVGEVMGEMRGDPGMMRPYFEDSPNHPFRGKPCVTINTGRYRYDHALGKERPERKTYLISNLQERGINSPVFNATSLRKEEWIELDRVVLRAARYRLRAWWDLAKANSFGGFNGMNKMILEHETMTDPGEAVVDMDGLTEGRTDTPIFQLQGLPLTITHSDFFFSSRRLGISRNTGTPLDSTMAEAAGRRVAENIEKTTIGNIVGLTYGGQSTYIGGYSRASSVYGYINFPPRLTYSTMNTPTGSNPNATLLDYLNMRNLLYANKFFGPFMAYHSNDWDPFLDDDYYQIGSNSGAVAPTKSLRTRLKEIEGVEDVRRLDFLFSVTPPTNRAQVTGGPSGRGYIGPGGEGITVTGNPLTTLMVQMTPDVARAVNGMDITTVQWETVGGMRLNFKVMCIQVPQLRADSNGNCGILQGTTSLYTPL